MTIVLGILLKLWSGSRIVFDFLKSLPWQAYAVLGAILAVLLLWHVHTSEVAAARKDGYAAGFAAAQAQVKAAQDKADDAQRAKNAVHDTKSAQIDTEKTNALLDANDDIDRRAAALRMQHDAAAQHPGVVRPLPETIVAPGGSAPSATCDGLSWDVALDVLTRAAKLEAQLNAVLDWEDAQDALAAKDGSDGGEPTDAEKAAAGP
jgi:hypothetical protein